VVKAESRSESFTDRLGKKSEHQFVVHAGLVDRVITLYHDPVTIGQPGRNRTLEILCLRFDWPEMRKDVETYVQRCQTCQQTKPRHEFKAPMGDVS